MVENVEYNLEDWDTLTPEEQDSLMKKYGFKRVPKEDPKDADKAPVKVTNDVIEDQPKADADKFVTEAQFKELSKTMASELAKVLRTSTDENDKVDPSAIEKARELAKKRNSKGK